MRVNFGFTETGDDQLVTINHITVKRLDNGRVCIVLHSRGMKQCLYLGGKDIAFFASMRNLRAAPAMEAELVTPKLENDSGA